MNIAARFIRSAQSAANLPPEPLPEVALVGQSNVGKSSLVNALTRQRLARTSAAPGKTQLANVYRVCRGHVGPLFLVDLPGYGYARGGAATARVFDELIRSFFGRAGAGQPGGGRPVTAGRPAPAERGRKGRDGDRLDAGRVAALLVVDARHPGLEHDVEAWGWLGRTVARRAIVATKIDKLSRAAQTRARGALESAFDRPALLVSAATGEGLDELWTLIDNLTNDTGSPRRR